MSRALLPAMLAAVCFLPPAFGSDEIAVLRAQLAAQQAQIDHLRAALEAQKAVLDRLAGAVAAPPAPAKAAEAAPKAGVSARSVNGFQFSGDFRFRLDAGLRSGNQFASPMQNVRSRYRLRLNIDKELDPRFKFHLQLSTGPPNNPITADQDMATGTARQPFSISEAWVDYHPTASFSLRGGRMEEVFADQQRFLWDNDIRFNGFQQILKTKLGSNRLGLTGIEFRAGQYIFSNPTVYVLPANSPYVAAGYQPGQKVRAAVLFHPGTVLKGKLGRAWTHQFTGTVAVYRHPNQIQLASTLAGFPVLVSPALGLALSGPMAGVGNATTLPGGAAYSAPDFQIAHTAWRLERQAVWIGGRKMPFWLDIQAARNVGASQLRDAVMASANLGAVRKTGDLRFLYQFAIKDANSMISQFTDSDMGTGSGVNIAVHAVRVDVGLTRFMEWQNLLFLQDQRRPNDPAGRLFVPLQRGANRTYRYLGQLAISF